MVSDITTLLAREGCGFAVDNPDGLLATIDLVKLGVTDLGLLIFRNGGTGLTLSKILADLVRPRIIHTLQS